ncbi:MAG: BON domain-containing protein [Planctomycetes bacterium]|nr:BON domain-containing protein [Planctomycetota bacterium]
MLRQRFLSIAAVVGMVLIGMPAAVSAQTITTGGGGTTIGTGGGGMGGGAGGGGGLTSANLGANANQGSAGATSLDLSAINSGKGSATSVPSNSNPFVSSYVDYLSVGMPSKFTTSVGSTRTQTGTFGQGIYTTTTTTTRGGAGAKGTTTTTTQGTGFNTVGQPRGPVYSTFLGDDVPRIVHKSSDLYANAKAAIERSSFLQGKKNIQVTAQGTVIILTGSVGSAREKRIVEGLVRTLPGVADVQNVLQVVQAK